MLKIIYSTRKPMAIILIFVISIQLLLPVQVFAQSRSQGPIADKLADYVDPFTGDFSYKIPLLNISGPNGESYPIMLNYSAGIGMNDEASWVGLGWELGVGEISRSVNGVADDLKSALQNIYQFKHNLNNNGLVNSDRLTRYFGPMYWKDFPYINTDSSAMDIYQSSRLLPTWNAWYYGNYDSYEAPNYDDYFVSGAGLNGRMNANLFQYGRLMSKDNKLGNIGEVYSNVDYIYKIDPLVETDYNTQTFSKSIEFRMKDEMTEVSSFSYSILKNGIPNDVKNLIKVPNTGTQSNISKSKYNTDIGGGDFVINEAPKGSIIKYFTNAEIATQRQALCTNQEFLDFQTVSQYNGTIRNSNDFPSDGIGAFQITAKDGRIYHYSLPVYIKSTASHSFSFLNTDLTNPTQRPYDQIDPQKFYVLNEDENVYAISWKLTAITGADYIDSNGDGVANVGDKGYWMSFNYGLWADNFNTTYPFYNFLTTDLMSSNIPNIAKKETDRYGVNNFKFDRTGSFSKSAQQIYYLDAVCTSTESAFFVKEIRYDAHSDISNSDGQSRIAPKLKLAKIVLVKNDQLGNQNYDGFYSQLKSAGGSVVNSSIGNKIITNVNANNIIDVTDFEIYKNQLQPNALKIIDFVTDYSLCKQLYNNAYNNFNTTLVTASAAYGNKGYTKATYQGTVAGLEQNSGKLTLKSLHFKEYKGVQVFPSYTFEYDEANNNKNPNFLPDKQDFWGFYKNDFDEVYRGHYTTHQSKNDLDAWSLKKIITPLGAEINVEYEADRYEYIGHNDVYKKGNKRPDRSFLIYDLQRIYSTAFNPNVIATFIDKDAISFLKLAPSVSQQNILKYMAKIPLRDLSTKEDISYFTQGESLSQTSITVDNTNIANRVQFNVPQILIDKFDGQSYFEYGKYREDNYNGFVNITLDLVFGGGLRVKSINVKDAESNSSYKKEYIYANGVATSEPSWFDSPDFSQSPNNTFNYELSSSRLEGERHKLNPSVGYTNVRVENIGLNGITNGAVEYEYNNYKEPFLQVVKDEKNNVFDNIDNFSKVKIDQISIVNDSNANYYGTLSQILTKDAYGNVLRTVKRKYCTIGLNEEAFYMLYNFNVSYIIGATTVNEENTIKKAAIRRSYGLVLKSETIMENGIVKEQILNQEFDRLSGQTTKVRIHDFSEGIKEVVTTPAYLLQGNELMGSKVNFSNNVVSFAARDNHLAAIGKTEIKYIPVSNMPADGVAEIDKVLLAGENTKWQNSRNVFSFQGTNSLGYPIYDFVTESSPYFIVSEKASYNGKSNTADWKKTAEVVAHDKKGNVISSKTGQNNYSAHIYDSYNREIASAINVKIPHFTYSSFEDFNLYSNNMYDFGSNVFGYNNVGFRLNTENSNIKPHTGKFVAKVSPSDGYGPHFMINHNQLNSLAGKSYIAKVWIHTSSPANAKLFISVKGRQGATEYNAYKEVQKSDPDNLVVGDWVLAKVTIDLPTNFNANSTNHHLNVGTWNAGTADAFYDDLICSPLDASIVGTVYDPITGWVSATVNNDGLAVFQEYDPAGRITYTKMETALGLKTVSQRRYNFAR